MNDPAIIPVFDIMGGVVVRAAGGRRESYQPMTSPLLDSADPAACVRALEKKLGFKTFYLADLDAIMGKEPNRRAMEKVLAVSQATFWLDAGYKSKDDALMEDKRIVPVIASETFRDWDEPGDLSRIIFSLDAYYGRFFCRKAGLDMERALEIVRAAGVCRFIHMRLDAVGMGGFNRFKLVPPRLGEQWYAAGGIRGQEDITALNEEGYAGALVSSALHEGAILKD